MSNVHGGSTYVDLVTRALNRFPDRVAFVHGDRRFTYREVHERIERVAAVLAARGLTKGDGVAVLAGNLPEAFIVQLAALSIGCRYTGLHPLGGVDDHAYVLEDAEISTLVYEPGLFDARVVDLVKRVGAVRDVLSFGPGEVGDDLRALADEATAPPTRPVIEESDLAFLPYTGGTTGRPKGVMLPHRVLVHNAFQCLSEWQWPEEVRFLACTPITHASGLLIVPALLRGGTVHLQTGFDPARFFDTIERERITATLVVPTVLYALLSVAGGRQADLASLKTVFYGASPISPTRLAEAMDVFGPVFQQGYAQTEAPNTVMMLGKEDHDPARPELLASCGKPVAGVQVEVLNEDHRPVPDGEVGEICVRGRIVMDGYWRQPELTAETLRGEWLHTGDMARRDAAGYVTIVDRRKDMVISGGFNVYPREVEDVLSTHPAVAMVAVVGVPDDKWGEAVRAVVMKRPGASVTADELIALVRERKGSVYAPKAVDFADSLPLTAVGKPDKKALREQFWAGQERRVH